MKKNNNELLWLILLFLFCASDLAYYSVANYNIPKITDKDIERKKMEEYSKYLIQDNMCQEIIHGAGYNDSVIDIKKYPELEAATNSWLKARDELDFLQKQKSTRDSLMKTPAHNRFVKNVKNAQINFHNNCIKFHKNKINNLSR